MLKIESITGIAFRDVISFEPQTGQVPFCNLKVGSFIKRISGPMTSLPLSFLTKVLLLLLQMYFLGMSAAMSIL